MPILMIFGTLKQLFAKTVLRKCVPNEIMFNPLVFFLPVLFFRAAKFKSAPLENLTYFRYSKLTSSLLSNLISI